MAEPSLEYLTSGIKQLIAEGELAEAIDQLKNYLHSNLPNLYNEVLVQAARYRRLLRDERSGVLTRDRFDVELTRIAKALLELLDELPRKADRKLAPLDRLEITFIEKSEGVPQEFNPEKILGINNLKQISWIERGVEVSRSVCRIHTPAGLGTGFLVSPQVVMTNNHVLPNAAIAASSVVEFNYQQDSSGKLSAAVRYQCDSDRFHTNSALDYTFVGVKPATGKPALETWGTVQLNPDADPFPTEHVCIVQHPNGGLKQIVLTSNWVVAIKHPVIHYTTDTMPGSSGSPVFNDTWHVVAIHHAAVPDDKNSHRYLNEGILMSAIKIDAKDSWPVN